MYYTLSVTLFADVCRRNVHNGLKIPLNARAVPLETHVFDFFHSHMVCVMKHHVVFLASVGRLHFRLP